MGICGIGLQCGVGRELELAFLFGLPEQLGGVGYPIDRLLILGF
jgi:hypothetical protein